MPEPLHAAGRSPVSRRYWLWAAVMAVLAAAAAFARSQLGAGWHLGDLVAIALMVSATFIILISQHHARQAAEDDAIGR